MIFMLFFLSTKDMIARSQVSAHQIDVKPICMKMTRASFTKENSFFYLRRLMNLTSG